MIDHFGKYEVNQEIGKGAMGTVYLAFDPVLERHVAIKTISTTQTESEIKERFIREARSAGRLHHQNIVTIHDFGQQMDTFYLVMEFLEGEDLNAIIEQRRPLDIKIKLAIISQVCQGLEYAHRHGVIHRDVKPSNIKILKDGSVKIMDFGLAVMTSSTLTHEGILLGTPQYISPERINGDESGNKSDQFSVGLLLYEILTYCSAFHCDSITETLSMILYQEPKALTGDVMQRYPQLARIISRAIAKKPAQRFANLHDMAECLNAVQADMEAIGLDNSAPIPVAEEPMAPLEADQPNVKMPSLLAKNKRFKSWLWVAISAVLIVFGVVIYSLLTTPPKTGQNGWLAFDIKPRGAIVTIMALQSHQYVPILEQAKTSPGRLTLPVGRYQVQYTIASEIPQIRLRAIEIKFNQVCMLADFPGDTFLQRALDYFAKDP